MHELMGLMVGLWIGCAAFMWLDEVGPGALRMTPGQLLVSVIQTLIWGPVLFVTRR